MTAKKTVLATWGAGAISSVIVIRIDAQLEDKGANARAIVKKNLVLALEINLNAIQMYTFLFNKYK